ncbi:fumarylacetoacetate hydrolase family protein [Actinoplanes sp. CA-030573]|uniref:fumarylacetoacetate hydrolase family protein n=1 Tax=Actinoplanes sp. CA-030573 TaxID=3239898 RepID=UPI003D8D87FB
MAPRRSIETDKEVELAIVVGRTARYLESTDEAIGCIGGYSISNDGSKRGCQAESGGQWDNSKPCETFNSPGP